jgi:hypothetical protein
MGGPDAPDDLQAGPVTQVWLATSDDPEARVSGRYFYHQRRKSPHPAASNEETQSRLLSECARISGVALPE